MNKKILLGFLVALVVIFVFGFFAIYLPYTRIKAKGDILVASAKELKTDFKKNNIDIIKNRMNDIDAKYKDFEKESKSVYWMSFIPYVHDFKSAVEAGDYMLKAGQETIDAVEPYADLIGFKKGGTSFSQQSSEDRMATAVNTLDKMLAKIDPISENIRQAEIRINTIDPNRYPEKIGNKEVKSNIVALKNSFDGIKSLFVDAKPLLQNLPNILGHNQEKTYLILYENEMEQRPGMGFLTYYAVFKIKDGRMHADASRDIYSLDDSISNHPAAPRLISTYHINVPKFNIRDSNLSPDLVENMKSFNSLYDKSGDKVKYDGVVVLDSKILVDMLTVFGDTTVDGINFSAKKNTACDCADVIYQLFYLVDKPTPYLRENRKAILGDLMQELIRKALAFSPSKYYGQLVQMMFTNLDQKNILLYFNDPSIQKAVESLNYAGRIRSTDGDYLHVNNANFAGAKSDLFVEKTLTSKTTISGGQVQREVQLDYKNSHPASDCNLERGNLCLNAPLRNLIRVYVPKGSKLVNFKGSLTPVKTYDELDKTVFEGFIIVQPLGKSQVTVTYTLPSTIDTNHYKLMIQKQPGEEHMNLNVDVNGTSKYSDVFDKDKQFSL